MNSSIMLASLYLLKVRYDLVVLVQCISVSATVCVTVSVIISATISVMMHLVL